MKRALAPVERDRGLKSISSTPSRSAKLSCSFFHKRGNHGDSARRSNRCGHYGQRNRPCLSRCGFNVVLCDVERRFLDRGLATIAKNLDREVAKNKIADSDKAATLARITPVVDRARLADCDLVIEAATEKFEIKAEIFRDLDRMMKPNPE